MDALIRENSEYQIQCGLKGGEVVSYKVHLIKSRALKNAESESNIGVAELDVITVWN
jgi:hypothetical protein